VAAYNSAIATVAVKEGAVVVDLNAAAVAAAAQGAGPSLISDDGFDPSVAGAQRIASQFAAVLLKP
jgi:lysophospholipase L1-like esterase